MENQVKLNYRLLYISWQHKRGSEGGKESNKGGEGHRCVHRHGGQTNSRWTW